MIVILITLDCVRKDYFNPDLMPQFFKDKQNWVSFSNAFSQSQNTLSSHYTMFTSQYLFQHGVYSNYTSVPLPDFSLDNRLRSKYFETKAVCGISFLANQLGNKVGETDDIFSPYNSRVKKIIKKLMGERRKAQNVVSKGLKWLLDRGRGDNKFLWLHFFDAHMPYYSPKKYFKGNKTRAKNSVKEQIDSKGWFSPYFKEYEKKVDLSFFPECYKGAISYIDNELNVFFSILKKLDLYKESLIFLTADHGECLLGDHNIFCAHKKLFDETVNVPLFVKFPENKYGGEECNEIVEHTDIAPTIAGYANIEEERYQGIDLSKLLSGKGKIRDFSFSEHVDNFMKAIRDKNFIYVERNGYVENKWQMKLEEENLFERSGKPYCDKDLEKTMKKKMDDFLKSMNYKSDLPSSEGKSSKEIEKQLKSLGYL